MTITELPKSWEPMVEAAFIAYNKEYGLLCNPWAKVHEEVKKAWRFKFLTFINAALEAGVAHTLVDTKWVEEDCTKQSMYIRLNMGEAK